MLYDFPMMKFHGLMKTKAAPEQDLESTEAAIFAAGCFWGVESEFRNQQGVLATAVGFMGGKVKSPTYKQVCYENTGHAEVVVLQFDPKIVKYEALLEFFWTIHDPTTLNRQGPDVGDQYRSSVFYLNEEQRKSALKVKAKLELKNAFKRPIVTEILSASEFTLAEDYHQQYIEKREEL